METIGADLRKVAVDELHRYRYERTPVADAGRLGEIGAFLMPLLPLDVITISRALDLSIVDTYSLLDGVLSTVAPIRQTFADRGRWETSYAPEPDELYAALAEMPEFYYAG
jgi:hypothetical protein